MSISVSALEHNPPITSLGLVANGGSQLDQEYLTCKTMTSDLQSAFGQCAPLPRRQA